MVKTEEMEWKRYYREERQNRIGEIRTQLGKYLSSDDPIVDQILGSGGALSFPHTKLDHSMIPVVRTVAGIIRGGYGRVVALGVFHRMSRSNVQMEFSLDGFLDIISIAAEISGKPHPVIEKYFLPRRGDTHNDIDGSVSDLIDLGKDIAETVDDGTAIIMTGDLVHYGHGYGVSDPVDDPTDLIKNMIDEDLNEAYRIRDYVNYLPRSFERMSDHGPVAITAGTILGNDLSYRIISTDLADYSSVLNVPAPTLVASVFYGVYNGIR